MAVTYSIIKFDEKHANAELRKKGGEWFWVRMPTSMDSLSRQRLMRTKEGIEAFCVYVHLVEISAKDDPRGHLADERGPMSLEDISLKTALPLEIIEKGIETLMSPQIRWITHSQTDGIVNPDPFPPDRESQSHAVAHRARARVRESSSSSKTPDTPDKGGAPESDDAAAAFAALDRIGMETASMSLAEGVTADTVIRHWLTITGKPKNPLGVLVRRLCDGTAPKVQPSAEAVARACREGWIQTVTFEGYTVDVRGLEAGANSRGVVIGNNTLPTDRIREAVFA